MSASFKSLVYQILIFCFKTAFPSVLWKINKMQLGTVIFNGFAVSLLFLEAAVVLVVVEMLPRSWR